MKKFHSGFVALIGRPNVGKSTLMNCLIGEKIAITSHKPQTTRNKITSILTKDDFQCVFLDTPGIHKPKSKLGEYMMRSAETTFNEVDLVLMLIEPTTEVQTMDEYVLERIKNVKTPVVLVINKIDTVEREALLEVISVYSKAYPFAEVVADFCHEGQKYRRAAGGNSEISAGGPAVFSCGYGDGSARASDCVGDYPRKGVVFVAG